MNEKQVLLWELTREEYKKHIEKGEFSTAIIPAGSTEQHLHHLAMGTDFLAAQYLAEQAALNLFPEVCVSTPVSIGISEHWMEHKGTLTLRPEVFVEILSDICRSLQRGGAERILILNGHGGNRRAIESFISEKGPDIGIPIRFESYWNLIPLDEIKGVLDTGMAPGHAQEFETSLAMVMFPHRVRENDIQESEARQADREKGKRMLDLTIEGIVRVLEEMRDG